MATEVLSRRTSTRLVQCEDCGWRGEMRECPPDYDHCAGVSPASTCPKCSGSALWWLEGQNKLEGDNDN